jgi:long-chain acyl-CoA synthetase
MPVLYQELRSAATANPLKVAVIDGDDHPWTYEDLLANVNDVASQLHHWGEHYQFRRVGILTRDSFQSIGLVFAIAKLDLSAVTLNTALRWNQIEEILAKSGTNWLITDSTEVERNFIPSGSVGNFHLYRIDQSLHQDYVVTERDSGPFLLTSSSGSTGDPKPIVFSQKLKLLRANQSKNLYGIQAEDIILNASPFSHSLGQRLTFLPLLSGATLILLPKFSVQGWIKKVQQYQVSFTICVSSHLHGLTKFLLSDEADLSSIRCLVSSSAALNAKVKSDLFLSKNFQFHEQYGASEVATVTNCSRDEFRLSSDTVGIPCDGVSIEIRRPDGTVCAPGVQGEIFVKSPLICQGYVNTGRIVPATDNSGWFGTSDLGTIDRNGRLYFLGRSNDVIRVGGQSLFPLDVERVILGCEGVTECCVVEKKDEYFGEIPVAFLVSQSSSIELLSKVREQVGEKLAAYQQPFHYIWMDELPRLQSGKLDKKSLRLEANKLVRNDGRRLITQLSKSNE